MERIIFSAVAAISIATFFAGSAQADPVLMAAKDGTVEMYGDLISYENELYNVETVLGGVLLSAAEYECIGVACPTGVKVEPVKMDIPQNTKQKPATGLFVRVN